MPALPTKWQIGLGLLAGAAVCAGALVFVQEGEGVAPRALVTRELKEGESHEYRLPLEPEQVLDVTVEQKGIDVSLVLSDPDGRNRLFLDNPIGQRGIERLFTVTDGGGSYRLRVQAATGWASGGRGRYVLRLGELRPAEARDLSLAQAFLEYSQGEAFRRQGTPEDQLRALVSYTRAFSLWQSLGDTSQQIIVLRRQGQILENLGRPAEVIATYQKALSFPLPVGDRVFFLNRLSGLHARRGEVTKALQVGEEALALAPRTGNPVTHAAAFSNLGTVYRTWGESDKALDYFRKSLDKWKEAGPHPQMAKTLTNQAELFLSVGNPRLSLRPLMEALRVQDKLGDHRGQAHTYWTLGVAFDRLGKPLTASGFLALARQRAHETGNRWVEGLAFNETGSTLLKEGRDDEAWTAFSEAGRIAREGGHRDNEAFSLSGLGNVLMKRGEGAGAIEYFRRSGKLYTEMGDPNALSIVLYSQALAERSLDRIDDALTSVNRALDLVETLREDLNQSDLRVQIIGARADQYDLKVDLLLRLHKSRPGEGYDAASFEASEWRRARSAIESVKRMGAMFPKGLSRDLLRRQGALRNRLQELAHERLKSRLRDRPAIEAEIRGTIAQWEGLAEEIRRQSPGYAAVTEPKILGVREVQELLDADTALIAYTMGAERSILWWIEKDSLEVHDNLLRRADLDPLARQAHELMSRPPRTKSRGLEQRRLERLSEILLDPVADRLRGVRRLVVVADESLQTLPFAALPAPGSGEPLVESHAVVQLPSASLASALRARQQERAAPPRLIAVFADPVFGRSDDRFLRAGEKPGSNRIPRQPGELARLPHSSREANAIMMLVPEEKSRLFTGFDANRHNAMDSELAGYQYLHFATHGLVDQKNPNFSGIQLSKIDPLGETLEGDGLLPFYEVYNLSLPADLVTLSACRTADGLQIRGEGTLGMSRSFLYAGASRVLGVLWDVDDADAADLMTLFYQALLRDGMSPSMALQDAQKALRARPRQSAPYHWAGFVLQGDWR